MTGAAGGTLAAKAAGRGGSVKRVSIIVASLCVVALAIGPTAAGASRSLGHRTTARVGATVHRSTDGLHKLVAGLASRRVVSASDCVATTASGATNTQLDCDTKAPNDEPNIVVDPTNPLHMVASSNAQFTSRPVCDPPGNPVTGEGVELKQGARGRECRICLGSGSAGHEEQQIGRGVCQVLIEDLARIFLEHTDLTKHDHAPIRHHWRCREEDSKGLGVELSGSSRVQVEVPGPGVQSGADELPDCVVLLIFVLPRDVVNAVE